MLKTLPFPEVGKGSKILRSRILFLNIVKIEIYNFNNLLVAMRTFLAITSSIEIS